MNMYACTPADRLAHRSASRAWHRALIALHLLLGRTKGSVGHVLKGDVMLLYLLSAAAVAQPSPQPIVPPGGANITGA